VATSLFQVIVISPVAVPPKVTRLLVVSWLTVKVGVGALPPPPPPLDVGGVVVLLSSSPSPSTSPTSLPAVLTASSKEAP